MSSTSTAPPPSFPRNNLLLSLPSIPLSLHSPTRSTTRPFTLRIFLSGWSSTPATSSTKEGGEQTVGRSVRFEITDEGGGGLQGDDQEPSATVAPVTATSVVPQPCPNPSITHYYMEIHEDSYHSLKSSQSLLVDFDDFPTFLTSVLTDSKNQCRLSDDGESGTGLFTVVEPSVYRELQHLCVEMVRPTDETVRPYMSLRINELLWRVRSEAYLRSVDAARVLEVTGERDLIQEKITRLEIEMEGRLKEVVMGKEEEMRGVIRGSEEDQKEEVRKVVEVYEGKIGELERRVRGLEDELRGMNVEKTGLLRDKFEGEGVLRTVRLELEQREKEVEEKSLRYHEVKDKMAVLEDDNKQLVREVTSLSVIANTYETERAKEKEGKEVVARMRSDWEQAKRSLEDNLEMLRQRGEGMGEKVKVASGEIKKGNEIIARLQGEYRLVKQKLKSKTESLRTMESRVGGLEAENGELGRGNHELTIRNEKLGGENERMERQLLETREKLAESARLLESNQQVISWLNKEVNMAQMGRVGSVPSSRGEVFSPSFKGELKVGGGSGLGAYISPDKEVDFTN